MTIVTVEGAIRVAPVRERFYVGMAAACLAVAVIGFAPTYWAPMARGTLSVAPITHLHGLLFYGWLLFFLLQTTLVASGRTARHREMGLLGIAIATAMFFVGMGAAVHRMRELDAAGLGEAGRRFAIVPVTSVTFFATLFALAIRHLRQPAIHKRLLLVASVSLLQAAVARWTRLLLAPAQPDAVIGALPAPPGVAFTIVPGLISDLILVAAIIHDRRTTGRVHPVYGMAGGALVALQVARVPLSQTDAWMRAAGWLVALAP